MLTPLCPDQALMITCRPSTVSSGRQYQRPRKRTLPSAWRHMASMRTIDSRPALKSSRGLRGACLEFAGFPAEQSAQCHSPCRQHS